MKKLLLALALLLLPSAALAQCNGVFPNNTACGNISGVNNTPRAIPLTSFPANSPGGTTDQIQYNAGSGLFGGFTFAGDCTVSIPNITCAKTNGVAFGPFATSTDAKNNIANFNSGTNANANTYWSGTGTWTQPPSNNINVLNSGLVADLVIVGDAVCNGTTTITSATANFTSAVVGKAISVVACGAAGDTLVTTIATFVNSTTVTTTIAAGGSSSGNIAAFGTDNTSALNTLIAATTNGGTLFFPAGNYGFAGTINIAQVDSVTLLGAGPIKPSTISQKGPTTLIYMGTDTANFIDIQSTAFTTIRNMMLYADATAMTGFLVTVRNNGNGDPNNTLFDSVYFSIPGNAGGLLLNTSTITYIVNTTFSGGEFSIKGLISSSPSSYSNVVHMSGGLFASVGAAAILNAGSAWSFDHVTFEQSRANTLLIYQGTSGILADNLAFTNCWMGDATVTGVTSITYYGNGFTFQNNLMAGGGSTDTLIDLFGTKGFSITGNVFKFADFAVNYGAATVQGGLLSGNAYNGVTAFEGSTGNKDSSVINTGNIAF